MDACAEIQGIAVQMIGKEHESLATHTEKGLPFRGP